MKIKTYILAVFSLISVVSCQKVVEFDIDEIPSQMVLNSLPSDGNQMFVNFAYSRFFLDTNAGRGVADIDMQLNVTSLGGVASTYRPASRDRNNYFFPYTPVGGDSLNISIKAGGKTVEAATRIPKPLQVENFATVNSWEMGMTGNDTVLNMCFVTIDMTDYADEDNYYYIRLEERDSGSYFSDLLQDLDTIDTVYHNMMFMCWNNKLTSPDVLVSSPMLVLPQGYTIYDRLIFKDNLIAGTKQKLGIILPILVDTNEVRGYKHEFTFHIESIRPERVKYLLDVATATGLTSMFAEPAGIYSNVSIDGEQGLGLFSGVSHRKFSFVIDPWPYPENIPSASKTVGVGLPSEVLMEFYRVAKQRYRK